jgi:hypothetical protein
MGIKGIKSYITQILGWMADIILQIKQAKKTDK